MGLRISREEYDRLVAAKGGALAPQSPPPSKRPRTRSVAEAELELRLEEAGITGWRTEYEFSPHGRRWRLDFAWPRERLAVEVDGSVHRTKGRFARDFDKHNALVLAEWLYLRFNAKHIATGKATETIRAALAMRAAGAAEEGGD
jgi:very-short-patch-repair endonuclease